MHDLFFQTLWDKTLDILVYMNRDFFALCDLLLQLLILLNLKLNIAAFLSYFLLDFKFQNLLL